MLDIAESLDVESELVFSASYVGDGRRNGDFWLRLSGRRANRTELALGRHLFFLALDNLPSNDHGH
jgi:hypothetical protein